MEVNNDIMVIESFANLDYKEIKPMKGIDFDQEAQRFEQAFRLNGIDGLDKIDAENYVSNIETTLFNKVGEYKMSIDTKSDEIQRLFNSAEPLSDKELLGLQYQAGMFVVEVTVVSNGSDKVSNGIVTLFQTK